MNGNIVMDGDYDVNNINFSDAGTINVNGNITGGGITMADGSTINVSGDFTGSTFTCSTGTVNFSGLNQIVGNYTYHNFTVSGGGTKSLSGPVTIGGTLTLTSGKLRLGPNNLTLTNTLPISGTFSSSTMIETNSTGKFIRSANATNESFNLLYPVGSGGYYNPLIFSSLPAGAAAARTMSVRAVPTNLGFLSSTINKYWDLDDNITLTTDGTTLLSFQYDPGEVIGDPVTFQLYNDVTTPGTYTLAANPSAPGVNPATSTGTTKIKGKWTAGSSSTFYSYISGNWNSPSTWTFDSGGTTGPATTIPGYEDKVVILNGRTVTLISNVSTQKLDITITSGGILNLDVNKFNNPLVALRGSGTLKLASVSFPVATTNSFVTTDGGTTEYNGTVSMSATQSVYYHLRINTAGTITLPTSITLNGDLTVSQGTFRINDATTRRLTVNVSGDVTVNNTGAIRVGNGVTNTTTDPLGIVGSTSGYPHYYEAQSHTILINGNFTNNGSVRFTNLAYPVYDKFPPTTADATTGFATVYFLGAADKSLICNGQTDFYNLVIDKGTNQTFKLTVNSSAHSNFRLYGANTAEFDITGPVTDNENPNLKKALWIKNGTLVLQGLLAIPSLSEGNTAGPPSSDYFIPKNGALVLDGGGVIVLGTADDYREINAAYNNSAYPVAAPDNASAGVSIGAHSGLAVLGMLQVNDGYLSTRESKGLVYWSYSPGQIIINGGKIDTKQFHNADASAVMSFVQGGGNFVVRGRFTSTVTYTAPVPGIPFDLVNATINTTRAANGVDATATVGAFSISSQANNAYTMSAGNLFIYDVCNTDANALAFLVDCPVGNINVTGGTVQIIPTGSVIADDADYTVSGNAPIYNLIVNRASGSRSVRLNAKPLVILNDMTITSGVFNATGRDLTIGGDFSIASGSTYTTGTNTTIFNGSAVQDFIINNASQNLNRLTIIKPAGIKLTLEGTHTAVNVTNDFRLELGDMDDNGKTVNIAGNVYNSGVHYGTGAITLNGTALQSIDGGGVFNNLNLNNSNASLAPISLAAGITVNGVLNFVNVKSFDIKTFNLRLNSTASITGTTLNSFIKSAGNAGDGGLTKVYSTPAAFNFPVGVLNYTPATIGLDVNPSVYGSITVIPVNYEHPNVTAPGRSLTYFWRTRSAGFTLGSAKVTHQYKYADANVMDNGSDITIEEYVPGRFDILASDWTSGVIADVNEGTNTIGGAFLTNQPFIDGDYTAGDDNTPSPFGNPTIYYSRINGLLAGSGLWSDVNSWSTDPVDKHEGAAATSFPGASSIVIIGGKDSIYLSNEAFPLPNTNNPADTYYQSDKASVSCASLQIEKGSCLDVQNNPGSNFGMVLNHPSGNGNFRLTTRPVPPADFDTPSTFAVPGGDFTDFNVNRGTTEFYGINPQIGTIYILPSNANSYGTVIISPLDESNIVLPNLPAITIYGDLISRGTNWESWLAMTWNTGYGVIVPKTVTVRGDLLIQGGSFVYMSNGNTQQTISIDGDVVVDPGAGIDIWGPSIASLMRIGGSLINNSNDTPPPASSWAGSRVRFWVSAGQKADVEFFGPDNAFITNTGTTPATGSNPYTIFGKLIVNKGSSPATTLTCNIGGILNKFGIPVDPVDNWLTLQNGTFIYNRTEDFNISTVTQFTIPATAGLTLNTPSNVYFANSGTNNNDLILSGKLTVINGNVFVGQTPSTAFNNDIEYTSSGASSIDIQGGNLVVNGQIRRNPSNAGAILKYSQSGGSVTINGQAANSTNAKLEVLNGGSNFTMSGGTLNILRGNGSTTTPSSPFGDLYLRPEAGSVTGGTITFSQGALASEENYFIDATIPLNNITIDGLDATNTAALRLLVSPLTVNGDMTINDDFSILNSNDIDITFNGDLINIPGLSGYIFGTNLTTFSGPAAQIISGGQTDFYDLDVNPLVTLTISNPSTISNNLTISSGTFVLGDNPVSVKGDFHNVASYTNDNSAGYGVILNGSVLQHISGNGAYNRLTLDNAAGAELGNSITLQQDLTMTTGIFGVKTFLLTLGDNSLIQGAPFGPTKMITSTGAFSDVGLKKYFDPVAATTTFLYPVGTAGKYTPAELTIDKSDRTGSIRINNITYTHPAVLDPSKVLNYYWDVESSGIEGFDGNLVFNYLQGDVIGNEADYWTARLMVPGTSWSFVNNVDKTNNKIPYFYGNSFNLSGQYTAGDPAAFPVNVPIYTSISDGNWNNPAIWLQTGGDLQPALTGGPNGFIVNIDHEVSLNSLNCFAYRTAINDRLIVKSGTYGHNLGTVTGSGTLTLESGNFPAGVFTAFLACANNSTVEYSGTGTYTIIADLYDQISRIHFTGTGTRELPNKDLTICRQFKIFDGVTVENSSDKKLTILGTMERANTGIFLSGSGPGATVTFAGSGPQTIGGATGNFTSASSSAFNNLEINNPSGLTIDPAGSVEVAGTLYLTNGLINTNTGGTLTITNSVINSVIPAGGTVNSFVNGPLTKRIRQFEEFLFPIGINKSGSLVPGNRINISSTQAGPAFWTAQYFNPNPTSASFAPLLLGVSSMEYFNVKTTAGSIAKVNLNWIPSSDVTPLVTGGIDNIRVARSVAGVWNELSTISGGRRFLWNCFNNRICKFCSYG